MKLQNPEVRIEPTNMCNARCIMCPREKLTRKQGIMNMALFKKIVDQLPELGCTSISLENYGEPFIDPTLISKAEYVKSKGIRALTISNGSLLNKETCEKIVQVFDKIRISLYATTKETYEKVQVGLNFNTVIKNIDNLFNARSNLNSKIRIEFYFLYMEENAHEKDQWLSIYENKADAVSIWKPHNWTNKRSYRTVDQPKMSCGRPATGPLQIDWNGKVVPCCFDVDEEIILGDLNTQTVIGVLQSKEYSDLRKAHTEGTFSKYLCNNCDQLNKRTDILVYTNIKNAQVGATNTNYDVLKTS